MGLRQTPAAKSFYMSIFLDDDILHLPSESSGPGKYPEHLLLHTSLGPDRPWVKHPSPSG